MLARTPSYSRFIQSIIRQYVHTSQLFVAGRIKKSGTDPGPHTVRRERVAASSCVPITQGSFPSSRIIFTYSHSHTRLASAFPGLGWSRMYPRAVLIASLPRMCP